MSNSSESTLGSNLGGIGTASQSKLPGLKAPSKIGRPNIPKPITTPTPAAPVVTPSIPNSTSSGANTLNNSSIKSASSANINDENENIHDLKLNDRVLVNGAKAGIIAFIGETQFKEGIWAGVVLDTVDGKNNGSIEGVTYFVTEENRGVFCRLNKLTKTLAEGEGVNQSFTTTQTSQQLTEESSNLKIGDRVIVNSSNGTKVGILRYLGETEFAKGDWAGVELSEKLGKNDGSVANKRYFQCEPLYGVFAPAQKVQLCPPEPNETSVKQTPAPTQLKQSLASTSAKPRLSMQPNAVKPLVSATPTMPPKTNLVSSLNASKLRLSKQKSDSQESLASETASVFSTASGVAKQSAIAAKLPPKAVPAAKPGLATVRCLILLSIWQLFNFIMFRRKHLYKRPEFRLKNQWLLSPFYKLISYFKV